IRDLESILREFGEPSEVVARVREARGKIAVLEQLAASRDALRNERARVEGEIREAITRLKSLESLCARAEEVSARLKVLRERERELVGTVNAMRRELELLYRRAGELKEDREKLERELRELRAKSGKVEELELFIEFLRKLRALMGKDGLQRELRLKAKPLIETYLRTFSSLFDLNFLDVRLTEDYDLVVVDSQGMRPIDTVSGGEKVALALALRLAIAKAASPSKMRMMMLDEPTVHLDDIRRRQLIVAIRRLFGASGNEFPQLILVTHDNELEEAADLVLRVKRTSRGSAIENVMVARGWS
ncbi:MAG TPA: hypothetical protein ENG30_00305, partial [Thermofilaceae archaeon]|nr:hypothetical protein [Thermofilaceae archaeon]